MTSQNWKFSVGICADLDHGEYFRAASDAGAEFFLLPVGGSGGANLVTPAGDQTKQAEFHRELHVKLMQANARQNGLYVFYANQAGHSGNAWFPGLALAVDSRGDLVDEHLPTEGMIVTEVSKQLLSKTRRSIQRDPATRTALQNSAGVPVNLQVVGGETDRQ